MNPTPYLHMYQFTPSDGPSAGVLMMLPRRYQAFGDRNGGGLYVWSDAAEGYVWMPGLTMKQWMDEGAKTP